MANEKRLIDANALLNFFQFRLPIDNYNAEVIDGCVKIARRIIENAPTVDAVEVVHGRWIPSKSMALSDKCSVCHGWVTRHSVNERKHRYCPNCGAKMDGDGNG